MQPMSFQNMMSLAAQVETALFTENDITKSRQLARELYQCANEIALQEYTSGTSPLGEDSLVPMISKIVNLVANTNYIDNTHLHRTLSKLFRVLIEIRWFQAISKKERMPVETSFRTQLIKVTQDNASFLNDRKDAVSALFEYRCARQGARMLNPREPLYKKYAIHLGSIPGCAQVGFPAGVSFNVGEVVGKLNNLYEALKEDDPTANYSWYPKVHIFRLNALRVRTVEDFNNMIDTDLGKEGGNYSNCLATIFKEIFKQTKDDELKQRVFKGLVDCIQARGRNDWIKVLMHPIDQINGTYIKADRFWETRQLAKLFLMKVAKADKYGEIYQKESKEALIQWRDGLRARNSRKSRKELAEITKEMNKLINEDNELEQRLSSSGRADQSAEEETLKQRQNEIAKEGNELLAELIEQMEEDELKDLERVLS